MHLALLAAVPLAILALPAGAETVEHQFDFAIEGQSLFGSGAADEFGTTVRSDLGRAAELTIASRAYGGRVDATVVTTLTAELPADATVATPFAVALGLGDLTVSFQTNLDAHAEAMVDVTPLFGVLHPPPFTVVARDYVLAAHETAVVGLGLAAHETAVVGLGQPVSAEDAESVTGTGVPTMTRGIVRATVTFDASQRSTLRVLDLAGMLRATHDDGSEVEVPFSLAAAGTETPRLPLDRPRTWRIEIVGGALDTRFESSFGMASTGTVGAGAGIGCGDLARDDDNGPLCAGDLSATGSTPPASLFVTNPFPLDFAPISLRLGDVAVAAQ